MKNFMMRNLPRAAEDGGGSGGAPAGAAPAAPGGQPPAAPAGADPAVQAGWDAGLPVELRTALAPKAFRDVSALAASYVNLEKKVGADTIAVPKPNAKPEEWDAFYSRAGRPAEPAAYALTPPEGVAGDPGLDAWYRAEAHRAGLNPSQASAIYSGMLKMGAEDEARELAAENAKRKQVQAALKQEWGESYDANVVLAGRAAATAMGDKVAELADLKLADGGRIGDHPLFFKAFANLGRHLGEDALLPGGAGGKDFIPGKAGLESELSGMLSDPKSAFWDVKSKDHATAKARVEEINRLLYPEAAA